jgi:excisionase family DNA binding protein
VVEIPESPVLTVEEAATILRLAVKSAYEAIGRNEIPHIRIGRRILIPRARLMALIESGGLQGKGGPWG